MNDSTTISAPTVNRALAALGGVTAAAAGLGVAQLVAGTSASLRSPVLSVGDRAVDLVPPAVKDLAISWFGTKDKIALLVGIAVVLTLYAAFLGILAVRRRLVLAHVGVGVFAAVGITAALTDRSGASAVDALPTLIGAAIAAAGLTVLHRFARPEHSADVDADVDDASASADPDLRANSRRRFIATSAIMAGAAAVTAGIGRQLSSRFSAAGSRNELGLPLAAQPLAPIPSGAQLDVDGISSFITPNADFYRIDTALTVPQVPVESWSLDISGMVDNPMTLSFDDLASREVVDADITLTCVSNLVGGQLLGTARWTGVRLDDLLDEAGIDPEATQIVGRSVDGYTCGFPVSTLDGRNALVAFGMNGEPLPLEHGFPARLIVPGLYGYVSATKWLTEIELTTFEDFDHYWVPRGYAVEAPIKAQTRIDTPTTLGRLAPGTVPVAGVAWAQPTGVSAVEVQIDDGDWVPAELGEAVNGSTWRQWHYAWEASTPGRHTITARMIDADGNVQTADRVDPLPDGATGLHTIVLQVTEA